MRLLDVIAHRNGLKFLTGDIGNAFIQTKTQKKCSLVAVKNRVNMLVRLLSLKWPSMA